jgi:membrane protein DedA with SNARE-associated domain
VDAFADWLIAFVSRENNPAGLAVLAGAAMVEYVFPPFPGDTITLFGAVLITAYGWSFWGVYGAVMAGSVAGSMAVFYLGLNLGARRRRRRATQTPAAAEPATPASAAAEPATPAPAAAEPAETGRKTRAHDAKERAIIDTLIARFERHGAAYLVLNRFVPGIRPLFFVAAGMAQMRTRSVLVASAASAALWNLGLIALGSALGASYETMLGWVQRYTAVATALLIAIALGFAIRAIVRRRRRRRPTPHP